MKKKIIIILCVAAVLVGLLVSPIGRRAVTLVRENIALVKAEYPSIMSFFGEHEFSTDEKGLAAVSESDRTAPPELRAGVHTEVLPSAYNDCTKESTVASVGDIFLENAGGATVGEDEKRGYTAIPVPDDRDIENVLAVLTAHGVNAETVTRQNTAPSGEVFAIRYAGMSDGTGFYIDPSVSVTLYVSAEKKATVKESGDNIVYLTFDDGPSKARTEELLDILDGYGIKGTFFTIGTSVENNPELVAEVVGRGHNLGCHTTSHVYSEIYASVDALGSEIDEWETAVEAAGVTIGDSGKLFRFPGGSVGNYLDGEKVAKMCEMLHRRGYTAFDWNVVTNDAMLFMAGDDESNYEYIKKSFEESLELCLAQNKKKTGAPIIVLMHETASETPELLKWVIEYFISRDFSFGDLAAADEWMFGG